MLRHSASALTNNACLREIYLPFDDVVLHDLPLLGEVLREDFAGHVSMEPDTEQPYSGHKVGVEARLIIERKGIHLDVPRLRCNRSLVCSRNIRYASGHDEI